MINTRLNQELRAGGTECDVFCSTDEGHYPPLIKGALLTQFTPPDLDLPPKQFQNLNPDHYYFLGAIGFNVINFRRFEPAERPPASGQRCRAT